jgi:tetratricopeptide (TPR) repeat protein
MRWAAVVFVLMMSIAGQSSGAPEDDPQKKVEGTPASRDKAAEETWQGLFILPRTNDVQLATVGARGKRKVIGDLDEPFYVVVEDKDGLVKVVTRQRVEGWVDKADVMPSKDAVDHFGDLIKKEPRNAWAHLSRAHAYESLGQVDEALDDLDEAIRLDPKSKTAWNSRGNNYYNRKDFDKALADMDQAVDLAPKDAMCLNDRGTVHQARKDYDKAKTDYDAAIKLEPKLQSAYANRASNWLEQKEFDKAMPDYDQAIAIDPQVGYVFLGRGRMWQEKKDYLKARFDYEEAVELDPNIDHLNAAAWLLATCPKAAIRNPNKAIRYAERAVASSESGDSTATGELLDTLAAAYAAAGRHRDAVRVQEQALEDAEFVKEHGEEGRERLELYRNKKSFVEK